MKKSPLPAWMLALPFALVLGLPGSRACGQTASLVKDIDVTPEPRMQSSPVSELHSLGEGAIFSMVEQGMWATDGSESGTRNLADICLGACRASAQILGTAHNLLFWTTSGSEPFQLWRSDGTRPGTFPLTGAGSGPWRLASAGPVIAGDLVYFLGCTDDLGCELWRTDGTRAGTQLVSDLVNGPEDGALDQIAAAGDRVFAASGTEVWSVTPIGSRKVLSLPAPRELAFWTIHRGRLFFADLRNQELWVSDGTRAGTRLLKRFRRSLGWWLTSTPGGLYFAADDGRGEEIWVSDGTEARTLRITKFARQRPFVDRRAVELGGRLLFAADDDHAGPRLWMSAGSPQTTFPISKPGVVSGPVKAGEKVFFKRAEGTSCELWSADAAGETTRLVEQLDCSPDEPMITVRGQLYFADSPDPRYRVWRTDGTPEGTSPLALLDQGPERGYFHGFAVSASGRKIFLPGRDGLWAWTESEGLRQVSTTGGPLTSSSQPGDFLSFEGRFLFSACDGTAREMWTFEGTASSTRPVTSFGTDCTSQELGSVVSGSSLFLTAPRLRAIDPAGRDTPLIDELDEIRGAISFRGKLYFFARDGYDYDFWVSDGAPAGTRLIWEMPESYGPLFLTPSLTDGESLFLSVSDLIDQEIWRSDGTPEGTIRLLTLNNSATVNFEIARLGSFTFFTVADRLWRTDGTPSGTRQVLRDRRNPLFDEPQGLVVHAGFLYLFDTSDAGLRWNLWRSDGTPQGTALLRAFTRSVEDLSVPPDAPVVLNGKLYFAMDDGIHGRELWVSNGTRRGTLLLADITPGLASSSPEGLVVARDTLYFAAHDPVHGRELWQSDGTEAGTRLVQDIAPGSLSSTPQRLTVFGDRLYFTADDNAAGRELWSLSLAGPSRCAPF